LFNKTVRSSLSSSYNTSSTDGVKQNSILNFRLNAGYQLLEKHQFNLSALSLIRNTPTNNSTDLTFTFGYNYSFTTAGKKSSKKREQVPNSNTASVDNEESNIKIRFRKAIYEGDVMSLLSQISDIRNKSNVQDMPASKKAELDQIKDEVLLLKSEKTSVVKEKIIDYLEAVHSFIDFKEDYNDLLFKAAVDLEKEALLLDPDIEKRFVDIRYSLENHKFKGENPEKIKNEDLTELNDYKKIYDNFINARRKFIGHRWMLEQLEKTESSKQFDKDDILIDFKAKQIAEAYKLYKNTKDKSIVVDFLISEMISHYQDTAKDKLDSTDYILKYIDKLD